MHLTCYLAEIRGERKLREISRASGVSAGQLSEIERGIRLPGDAHVKCLETAYGTPIERWYPPRVLLAMRSDDPPFRPGVRYVEAATTRGA